VRCKTSGQRRGIEVPLRILNSPFREVTKPVIDYVRSVRRESERDVVTVFIPEYVVGRWWENLLHNQSALRLKARLLFVPGVMVTSVSMAATLDRRPGTGPIASLCRVRSPSRRGSRDAPGNASLNHCLGNPTAQMYNSRV